MKCKRCGACCIMGPCSFGKEDLITGSCIYLKYSGNIAICPIIKEGNKKAIEELKVGIGCVIRGIDSNTDHLLDEYVKTYKNLGD